MTAGELREALEGVVDSVEVNMYMDFTTSESQYSDALGEAFLQDNVFILLNKEFS